MTVCVAAISRFGPSSHIVAACDLMLSTDIASLDTSAIKIQPLSPRWGLMFSGGPTTMARVHARAKEILVQWSIPSLSQVETAVTAAYQQEEERAINEILGVYGIDRAQFLQKGRMYFGDALFTDILYEIKAVDLETEFLVAGFDSGSNRPRLFHVGHRGESTHHDRLGFWAIGAGAFRAQGSLYTHYFQDLPLTTMVYRVCEAKFLAESAPGVGRRTFVVLLRDDQPNPSVLMPNFVEPIRKLWDEKGRSPVPDGAAKLIEERMQDLEW